MHCKNSNQQWIKGNGCMIDSFVICLGPTRHLKNLLEKYVGQNIRFQATLNIISLYETNIFQIVL